MYHVQNPGSSYQGEIPGGLTEGKKIIITGCVGNEADRLAFNLVTYEGHIALHINPRFADGIIVRNSLINGIWGQEERHGSMIFQRGVQYELTIDVLHDKYTVRVNGHFAFAYAHRVSYQEITRLEIQGQQSIHGISYLTSAGQEIRNPNVPFSWPIHGFVQPGRGFQFRLVPHDGRFVINFQTGSDLDGSSDIQFHVSVRWDDPNSSDGQPVAVRTHCRGGNWGNEDREPGTNSSFFPFQRGVEAEVMIVLDSDAWKMAVNGQHFASMPHHTTSYQLANHININGNVQVKYAKQF